MATDINKTLNLEAAILNLETLISRVEKLNEYLNQFVKTAADAAKAQTALSGAQAEGEKVVEESAAGVSELEKLQQQQLKTAQKLEVSRSSANEELIRNKVALQQVNAEVTAKVKAEREAATAQAAATKALTTSVKTIREAEKQNKALRLAVKNVDTTTKEGRKQIEEYNKVIEENDSLINQNSDTLLTQFRNVGNYQSALGGLVGGFQQAGQAAKAFLANPVAATVAVIVGAFKSLYDALNSTEEGQLALATVTGFFKGILTGLQEIVVSLTKPLIALFNDPRQALSDFVTDIKTKVFGIFENLKNIGLGVGKILSGIWERDLEKIKEGASETGQAFSEIVQTTNPLIGIYAKIAAHSGTILKNAIENAAIEKARTQLAIDRNKFIVREAELVRDIALAQEDSKNTELDIYTRKNAIIEAEKLIRELTQTRINDKQRELDLLIQQQGLSSNNISDNEQTAQLQAEIIRLTADQANQLKGLYRDRDSINNLLDKTISKLQTVSQLNDEIAQIEADFDAQLEAEFQKDIERQADASQAEIDLADKTKQAKIENTTEVAAQGAQVLADAFLNDKQAAYAGAIINTAQGVSKALAQGGILGIATGAIVAANGAVQIAKIAATSYFTGTRSAKRGLAELAERGAEVMERNGKMYLIPDRSLVDLQGGERIYNNYETRNLFNDSGIIRAIERQKQNIIVNIRKDSYVSKYAFN